MAAAKLYPMPNKELAVVKDLSENYLTGFIKLYRSIRNHWIWEDAQKLKWWLDILMECNHEDKKANIGFELFECKRGQSLHSIMEWAKRWRVDKSTARRFLDLLEADGMIVTENLIKTTRLTVCNYGSYNDKQHAKQLADNSQTTRTQHEQELEELKEEYKRLQKTKENIWNFIRDRKPEFIDPYVGIWNCFAEEKELSKVAKITETRRAKFSVRRKEKDFDFLKILRKASASEFLLKNNWFSFDWILENEQNWVRIIEGVYDNGKKPITEQKTKSANDILEERRKAKEKIDTRYAS